MIASGYSLDLYCEVEGNRHAYQKGQAQFFGENWADCVKQAKAAGWKISKRKRACICPDCLALGLKM